MSIEEFESLFLEPLRPEDGYVALPDKPGLGLEIDEKVLEQVGM